MTLRIWIVLSACVLLTACGRESTEIAAPREPDRNSVGFYCRMGLAEHKGPKGQILPKGSKDPLWFSSVRDAFTYLDLEVVGDRDIAGFWVNDMTQGTWEKPAPGSWVDARTAWYVIGSRMVSGMGGGEAVPFKERQNAEAFIEEFGGHVADYLNARQEIAEAPAQSSTDGGRS